MFDLKPEKSCQFDLVSLGEVMLRFCPENSRIQNARQFSVYEGGGEYNVARGLGSVFGLRTSILTALADNQIGRLIEGLILQGRVDAQNILWRKVDGIGRNTRNGLYFFERGFGHRPPTGCSDRAGTAVSQIAPNEFDFERIFTDSRVFHTGGIFVGLSENTPSVALEAVKTARSSGAIVSYDLNYRGSLWEHRGGLKTANTVNRRILPFVDVLFGLENYRADFENFDQESFADACAKIVSDFPNIKIIATPLRRVVSTNRHHLSGACYQNGRVFKAQNYFDAAVLDRIGSGDAFASGFLYGLLNRLEIETALEYATAHAVLAMTTVGDNSMVTKKEIEQLFNSKNDSISR